MSPAASGVDVLAIAAHPDDVEIACGGTVLGVTERGGRAALVDLTAGERATRGSGETRSREAREAAALLGVRTRDNLGLADCGVKDDEPSRRKLADAIRRHRPRLLLAPHPEDDHPDHAAAGRLAVAAAFLAGVGGYDATGDRHRSGGVLFYMMHHRFEPTLIVDVSEVYEKKIEAIRCYASQLHRPEQSDRETNIASKDFLDRLRARNRFFGEAIGVEYGEPFAAKHPPGLADLRALLTR